MLTDNIFFEKQLFSGTQQNEQEECDIVLTFSSFITVWFNRANGPHEVGCSDLLVIDLLWCVWLCLLLLPYMQEIWPPTD